MISAVARGMDQDESAHHDWLTHAVRAGKRYHFQYKTSWRHNMIGITVLTAVAIGIAGLLLLSTIVRSWLYVPLAGIGFGLCYYTLFALVVHEASHGMMFLFSDSKRRKRCNRAIGWVCATPFAIHYRRHWEECHLTHHLRPVAADDPQAFNRLTGKLLAFVVLLLLLVPGSALIHSFSRKRSSGIGGSSPGVMMAFVAIWSVLIPAAVYIYSWPAALALVYGLHVVSAMNQVKGSLEHGGEIAFDREPLLRSRSAMFPLRVFWPMFYVTIYHFEHHLNYTVPWYDLPKYHRDVRALVPRDLHSEIFNSDLFAQLAGRKGAIPASRP